MGYLLEIFFNPREHLVKCGDPFLLPTAEDVSLTHVACNSFVVRVVPTTNNFLASICH